MWKLVSIIVLLVFYSTTLYTQKRWTGQSASALWEDAGNWEGGIVPQEDEEIILDNSFLTEDYFIYLPSGSATINITRLIIMPGAGKTISLIINNDNTASPAIIISGAGTSLTLKEGATLINYSGASSGEIIQLAGKFRIETGGRYIHKTRRPHATLVSALEHDTGTRHGVFEFEVPYASSTISLSGRKFGNLVLTTADNQESVIYTAAGVNPVTIYGDFVIGDGVSLKMNFSDTLHIYGNYLQYGGSFDLATTERNLYVNLSGNLYQEKGLLTVSGQNACTINFSGSEEQLLEVRGALESKIHVRLDNVTGVRNTAPLYLPDSVILVKGKWKAAASNDLILGPHSWIDFDEQNSTSFIEGVVIKEGLSPAQKMKIPLGARNSLRWLGIEGATGTIKTGYLAENPRELSENYNGIHHISALEYWEVIAMENDFAGKLTASFSNGHQSGVTEMATLTTAIFRNEEWNNSGKTAETGSPGGHGSVTSENLPVYTVNQPMLFTLAAMTDLQNPLPVKLTNFRSIFDNKHLDLYFTIEQVEEDGILMVRLTDTDRQLSRDTLLNLELGVKNYKLQFDTDLFYRRIKMELLHISKARQQLLVAKMLVNSRQAVTNGFQLSMPRFTGDALVFEAESEKEENVHIILTDNSGRIIQKKAFHLQKGKNTLKIKNMFQRFSVYYIFGITSKSRSNTIKILAK